MKRRFFTLLTALTAALFVVQPSNAQIYGKLNALYACVGVVNPQVEFRLSQHSTFQTELVVSPHRRIFGEHRMLFGIFMNGYRYYFKEHNRGLYVGVDAGIQVFNMSKPSFAGGKLHLQDRYCKGYGYMVGGCVGYEHRLGQRWLLDAFAGFGYLASWYNGYDLAGNIDMHPHGHDAAENDPFNGSAEWLPTKIGLSIGYRLFDPKKHKYD